MSYEIGVLHLSENSHTCRGEGIKKSLSEGSTFASDQVLLGDGAKTGRAEKGETKIST